MPMSKTEKQLFLYKSKWEKLRTTISQTILQASNTEKEANKICRLFVDENGDSFVEKVRIE